MFQIVKFYTEAIHLKDKIIVELINKEILDAGNRIENKWKNKRVPPKIRTKKELLDEYIKCKNDPVYFIFTYGFIQHPIRGRIKPDEYPYLVELIKVILNNRFNIINKARQLHISTIVALYITWLICFYADKEVLVIATKSEVAKNLIKKVKFCIANLPKYLKPKLKGDNVFSVSIDNGSTAKSIATTVDAGRSEALSLLVVDEAAHITKVDMEEVWTAAQPTLITGGSGLLLSSPNGVGNFFHRTFTAAQKGENIFNPITLKWNVHPLRDQKWRDEQDKVGSKKAAQENDADFISSGDTVIKSEIIVNYYQKELMREPLRKFGLDKSIWMYEQPISGCRYLISADCSRGDAGSKSAFTVLNLDNLSVDCDYSGLIKPNDFGELLVEVAKIYNNALIAQETNYLGPMVLQKIIDLGYDNIYYTSKINDLIVDPRTIKRGTLYDENVVAGFVTSSKNRTVMIEKLVQLVESKEIKIYSRRILDQFLTFKFIGNRAQAEQGYNDDLIMALCISIWIADISIKIGSMRDLFTVEMMKGISVTTSSMVSPFLINGDDNKQKFNEYYTMNSGDEEINLYDLLIRN